MTRDTTPLVLVVDDDLATRLLMRASLEKTGFRVAEAEDGLQAINTFPKERPHAVLLDVMMPRLDGHDTCRAIRKLPGGEHTPILMVTGLEDIEAIHQSFEAGATDFITKPINWTVLNYRVKYMLRASEAFTDVINKQQQIQELAYFDHLTGLANRAMFKENLELALAEGAEQESMLAVLFLDLDRFKTINDTLGHQAGDTLLKNAAARINDRIRETDLFSRFKKRNSKNYISRLGGDEFTVLLPGLKEPEDAGKIARRINETLAAPFSIEGKEAYVTASIGISIFPLDGTDAEELMRHADLAMYHAKEKGKNGFQFYKRELNLKAEQQFEFENDVRRAVDDKDFQLYYQPQFSMIDGGIIGAEALSRWPHQKRGMVPPAQFIPAIEDLGLIGPFTDTVIEEAGSQLDAWEREGLLFHRVAINISSQHFKEQCFPEKFQAMIRNRGLRPGYFELELTESVLARQDDETFAILDRLKKMGLSISVDDFGTGYSSLSYLKTFPIDIVKIDRFFIRDILTSQKGSSIVKAIIALAHSMEMKVIAEGIEEKEQFDVLQQMGCDYGQGYLFSPAVPAEDFARMIRDNYRIAS